MAHVSSRRHQTNASAAKRLKAIPASQAKSSYPVTALPFVADVKEGSRSKRRSFWHVPPAESYAAADLVGYEYAHAFLKYLEANPANAGSNVLGLIASEMATIPVGSPMRGYAVGFWSGLELFVARAIQRGMPPSAF